jgi:hypothetical protein
MANPPRLILEWDHCYQDSRGHEITRCHFFSKDWLEGIRIMPWHGMAREPEKDNGNLFSRQQVPSFLVE